MKETAAFMIWCLAMLGIAALMDPVKTGRAAGEAVAAFRTAAGG